MGHKKMHALHVCCSNLPTLFVTTAKNSYSHDESSILSSQVVLLCVSPMVLNISVTFVASDLHALEFHICTLASKSTAGSSDHEMRLHNTTKKQRIPSPQMHHICAPNAQPMAVHAHIKWLVSEAKQQVPPGGSN